MLENLNELWAYPWLRASLYLGGAAGTAYVIRTWLVALVLKLTSGTKTGLDDLIALRLRRPLYISVVLVGVALAYREVDVNYSILWRFDAFLKTLAILLWASAGSSILTGALQHLTSNEKQTGLLQARTLPVISLFGRTSIWLFAVYLFFLSWRIDLTAWLASAGVIGLAVGFAAKDTLANLFAGIAILADSPFRVGDYITLEGGDRGRVTYIGMRSTRLLTADEIELIIPNSVIASSQIVNETGGPGPLHRLKMPVSVAYGSDLNMYVRPCSSVLKVLYICRQLGHPRPSLWNLETHRSTLC